MASRVEEPVEPALIREALHPYPDTLVTVSYELTDLGLSLHETIRGLKLWAQTHMDDVLAHRAAYDDAEG